jgi:hypothetical protein
MTHPLSANGTGLGDEPTYKADPVSSHIQQWLAQHPNFNQRRGS